MNPKPSFFRSFSSFALFFLLALAPNSGCDDAAGPATETGELTLSVGTIPEDIACIRVSIAGESRSVVSDLDVAPGEGFSQAFTGLPVGAVVFSANAYSQACGSIGKSTAPMWVSEPKTVNVVQGKSTTVTLILLKNGRAKVTLEFGDQEDAGVGRPSPDAGAGTGG